VKPCLTHFWRAGACGILGLPGEHLGATDGSCFLPLVFEKRRVPCPLVHVWVVPASRDIVRKTICRGSGFGPVDLPGRFVIVVPRATPGCSRFFVRLRPPGGLAGMALIDFPPAMAGTVPCNQARILCVKTVESSGSRTMPSSRTIGGLSAAAHCEFDIFRAWKEA